MAQGARRGSEEALCRRASMLGNPIGAHAVTRLLLPSARKALNIKGSRQPCMLLLLHAATVLDERAVCVRIAPMSDGRHCIGGAGELDGTEKGGNWDAPAFEEELHFYSLLKTTSHELLDCSKLISASQVQAGSGAAAAEDVALHERPAEKQRGQP